MKMIFLPLILMNLFFISCKEEEPKYTKEQLYFMAKEIDSNLSFVLPKTLKDGIKCSDYIEGCLSGHTVRARGLEMIAVEFAFEKQARDAAIKYNGYYLRNWMFDDVSGEPLLEDFVKLLKAEKPSEAQLEKK